MRRILIVGASSLIAEHCARVWAAEQPTEFVLVGRDAQKLQRVALDLQVRATSSAPRVVVADLLSAADVARVSDEAFAKRVDVALVAHGMLPLQEQVQPDPNLLMRTLEVNGVSPCLWAEAIADRMERGGGGLLVVIGSVAGDRGRVSNYMYGAGKGMVERFVQGLQHRFAGTAVRVVLAKPGPTATPMHATIEARGPVASPDSVARAIVAGAHSGARVIYTPKYWWLVMQVIRHLPFKVFAKLKI